MTREENIRRTMRGYARTQAVREIERAIQLEGLAATTTDPDVRDFAISMASDANDNAAILIRLGDEIAAPLGNDSGPR